MGTRVREHYPKCNFEFAFLVLAKLYKEPTAKFLPISSCSIYCLLLLELSRGNGKNNRHCGSYLHLAPVFRLCLNATLRYEKANGSCGRCPVIEKHAGCGDEFLQTLVETAWNLECNRVSLLVQCALLTLSALLHPCEVHLSSSCLPLHCDCWRGGKEHAPE